MTESHERRLHGIGETIKHAREQERPIVRVRRPSERIVQILEEQGHHVGDPDHNGKCVITIAKKIEDEPEVVIDNPDPKRTP